MAGSMQAYNQPQIVVGSLDGHVLSVESQSPPADERSSLLLLLLLLLLLSLGDFFLLGRAQRIHAGADLTGGGGGGISLGVS